MKRAVILIAIALIGLPLAYLGGWADNKYITGLHAGSEDVNDTLVEDVNIVFAGDAGAVYVIPDPEPTPTYKCPVHGDIHGWGLITFDIEGERAYTCCSKCVFGYVIPVLKENIPQLTEIKGDTK